MNVFLTGATGHLGGELLVVLSKLPAVERIFCLVRAKRGEEARARLVKVFGLHGDAFDPSKVHAIEGDLLDPELATSLERREELGGVDTIVHSAANTSFSPFHGPAVDQTNLGGLERILRWAARLPRLGAFMYVGTAAICGCDIRQRVVQEDESPNPAARHLVRYTKSKLQAELLVRQHLRPEQVLIARPSILLGDRRGKAPRSADVLWAVAVINLLRLIPVNPHLPLDIVPIDHAAQAIAALLFAERHHDVYHVSAGIQAATSAHELSIMLSAAFPELPPFRFDERISIHEMRRWIKGKAPPTLDAHGDYLRHWTERVTNRRALYAMFSGLAPYLEFMQLGQVFDNGRLLRDTGVVSSEPAHSYLRGSLRYLDQLDLLQGAFDP